MFTSKTITFIDRTKKSATPYKEKTEQKHFRNILEIVRMRRPIYDFPIHIEKILKRESVGFLLYSLSTKVHECPSEWAFLLNMA